jgi:hypothetical protein
MVAVILIYCLLLMLANDYLVALLLLWHQLCEIVLELLFICLQLALEPYMMKLACLQHFWHQFYKSVDSLN